MSVDQKRKVRNRCLKFHHCICVLGERKTKRRRKRKMVNIFVVHKALLRGVMSLVGVRPQVIEIEPGTVLNFWVSKETRKKPDAGNVAKNKPRKPKPAVVFLHAFATEGIFDWQFQVLALARKYRVYVPDLLFFGGSVTDKKERSPAFQAECVAKGLRKLGVEKCTLIGSSYGGMVGFKMAEMYPDLVDSMVVTCSVMALTESIKGAILERVGYESLSKLLLPDSVKDVELLSGFVTYKPLPMPRFFYKHYLEAMFNNRKEKEELLEALVIDDKDFTPAPYPQWFERFVAYWCEFLQRVHLLWGGNDSIFPLEIANDLKGQLGDKTTLQYIEKAGHAVQMERPRVYSKRLKEILATLTAEGLKEQ